MGIKLSKIAKELNLRISFMAEFINNIGYKGYKCTGDPNEELSEELEEFIRLNIYNNLYLYDISKIKYDKKEDVPISLSLKINAIVEKERKLIEDFIGWDEFDWNYTVAKYKGKCSVPIKFNLFDEAICGILLKDAHKLEKIGGILGFDIETDPAEKEILLSAINDLIGYKMVDGNEYIYWLTDLGYEYTKDGVRFSTYEKKFDLYIDNIGSLGIRAKDVFSELGNIIKELKTPATNLPKDLDAVRTLAEEQAPEIHFPDKKFFLQNYELIGSENYIAKVYVILLKNFRDDTYRTIVYDEKQDKIIKLLSDSFDSSGDKKQRFIEELIKKLEDNGDIEITDEPISEDQIRREKELIKKYEEIEEELKKALDNKDRENLEKASRMLKNIVGDDTVFRASEFKEELIHLFDTTSDELWLISPWLKKVEWMIPYFEKYLQKGGRIFVAFSLPEGVEESDYEYFQETDFVLSGINKKTNKQEVVALENILEKLCELEKDYSGFYVNQLNVFHNKELMLKKENGSDLYYVGSYNMLSFDVKDGAKNYRQEKMMQSKLSFEGHREYTEYFVEFGKKYISKSICELNELFLKTKIDKKLFQEIESVGNNDKLKLFLNKGYDDIDNEYDNLEKLKEEVLNSLKKRYYTEKLEELKEKIDAVKDQKLPLNEKKNFQDQLNDIAKEYPDVNQFTEYHTIEELITHMLKN